VPRTASAASADTRIGDVLERFATWLRRTTPAFEWNQVALSTLSLLVRKGPLRITDLVAAERITQPGMTSLVGRMASAGLVTRTADPTDGRATLVQATEAGRAYLDQCHSVRAEVITRHVRELPPQHRQALLAALDAIEVLAGQPTR
jgi:DNA-binding MarR family transcriptional regulator